MLDIAQSAWTLALVGDLELDEHALLLFAFWSWERLLSLCSDDAASSTLLLVFHLHHVTDVQGGVFPALRVVNVHLHIGHLTSQEESLGNLEVHFSVL